MTSNCSDLQSHPRAVMNSTHYFTTICYSICFCIALIGNGTMFLILVRNQRVKVRRVHTLLLHMNIAHLIVTLIYMPKEVVHNITVAWWGGDFLCRTCKFFDNFGNSLAANVLICMSLDRFYSIFSPLHALNAKKSIQKMVVIAWIVSFLTSLPAAILFRTSTHPCAKWFIQCVSGDFVGVISHSVVFAYTIVNLAQVSLLPLVFTVSCYLLILYKISTKTGTKVLQKRMFKSKFLRLQTFAEDVNYSDEKLVLTRSVLIAKLRRSAETYERARSRTLKMTFVVVITFLLCWTPYAVASLVHFTLRPSPIPAIIRKLFYAFAVFNSAISPYLYGYFSFDLKKELLLLMKCATEDTFAKGLFNTTISMIPKKNLTTRATNLMIVDKSFPHSPDEQQLVVSNASSNKRIASLRIA